jgi:TfoX/Sxy family transcriptional regulator of competence genes
VAYDEALADRIRELIAAEPGVTEQKMFGGLGFMIGGNMAVAASGQGGLLVRVDPAETEALVEQLHASRMEMRGRAMDGWLRVDAAGIGGRGELEAWVRRGAGYARSLPPKR